MQGVTATWATHRIRAAEQRADTALRKGVSAPRSESGEPKSSLQFTSAVVFFASLSDVAGALCASDGLFARALFACHHFPSILKQCSGFGKDLKSPRDLGVTFQEHLLGVFLGEMREEVLVFDLSLNEVQILNEVTFLIGNFLGVQKMSEFREDSLIDLKGLFRIRVAYVVTANEAKELRLAQQLSLKFVELGDFNLNIRDNPPAARHFATAVCILDLGRGCLLAFVVVIVVVGFVRVVSLDQP